MHEYAIACVRHSLIFILATTRVTFTGSIVKQTSNTKVRILDERNTKKVTIKTQIKLKCPMS